jgi:sugar lactone lactonase YvrE
VLGGLVVVAIVAVGALLLGVDSLSRQLVSARKASDNTTGSGLGKEFDYDLKAYRKTDPKLLAYKEEAPIPTGFAINRGLAVGKGDLLYVAGDATVRIFDKDGNQNGEFADGMEPRGLAVASDGSLYVAMKDHVEVCASEGDLHRRSWERLGPKALLTSIAVGDKDVFVADAGNRIVIRYDRSGKKLGEIGRKDAAKNIPGFLIPSPYFDLAIAPDGLLRVVNPGHHRIEAYTFDGDLETSWGTPATTIEGFSGCCNPTHIAILPDGRFVTSEKGLARVKVYDSQGKFQCVVAGCEAFTEDTILADLTVDSKGRVLVLDPVKKAVRVFVKK